MIEKNERYCAFGIEIYTVWCDCCGKDEEFTTDTRIASGDKAEPEEINGKQYLFGLAIYPQTHINTSSSYRVDFVVEFHSHMKRNGTQDIKSVIVECDSQQFHERTEKERRYEKRRDRYFVSKGRKVFHYTGSEIAKNALGIAAEIISFVTEDETIHEEVILRQGGE